MATARLENVSDVYVLSPVQEGLLYHTVSEPGSGVYVNQISTLIDDLSEETFRQAWDRLIARHAPLRTAFMWHGLDEPLQVVRDLVELPWTFLDWTDLDDEDQSSKLQELLEDDRSAGFDLTAAPLMRMLLIRLDSTTWRWVWSFHHLIVDGWSAQVILAELRVLYSRLDQGEEPALEPPPDYGEFIGWMGKQDTSDTEPFWREELAGVTSTFRVEVPGIQPATTDAGHDSMTMTLDQETTSRLREMASGARVTLNTAVMGAWALVLSRWSRDSDVVFGVTTSGRPAELANIERAVGLFINTLPMRLDLRPKGSISDWLREVQSKNLALQQHEHESLASVKRWSDVPSGQPLFESIFVFENYPPAPPVRSDALHMGAMNHIEQSNYPLAVLALPGEKLEITFIYDTARLHERAIASLGDQLKTALGFFAADPSTRLADVGLVRQDDVTQLRRWETGPRGTENDSCIHDLISQVIETSPQAEAVVYEGTSMTYSELGEASSSLAARLQAHGVGPGTTVGLYLSRSIELVVGMLGILKAGGAYVPLDAAYPPAHVQSLLADDHIEFVVTDARRHGDVPEHTTFIPVQGGPTSNFEYQPGMAGPDDLAYVIHTSGSTGRPKGVMVTHRNLVASTLARNAHYGDPVGRFLLLSSFAFDSSVVGIFWTLTTGGTIILPTSRLEQDMGSLLNLAEDQEVTHLLGLPALYELMLDAATEGQLDSLDVAIVAGEACPPAVVRRHVRQIPHAELHNEYGPTEATVWCTAHRIRPEDVTGPVPIGRPIQGAEIRVVDPSGHRCPPGFAGEVMVGGSGVALGYLDQGELTSEKFQQVEGQNRMYRTGDLAYFRSDGNLVYLGRADSQVKVRGHRIEVSAVESAVRALDDVRDVCVSAADAPGRRGLRLIAYASGNGAGPVDGTALLQTLRARLPEFMVPDLVIPMEQVPRLPNGKIDQNSLPDPGVLSASGPERVAPRNDIEAALASIWSELLQLDEIGVHDDYFSLGGDSLLSIRLFSRIEAELGSSLPLNALLRHPTIAGLAQIISGPDLSGQSWESLVPLRTDGSKPPIAAVHAGGAHVMFYRELAKHLGDDQPVYGLEPIGLDGSVEPIESIPEMASKYIEELLTVQPEGPYRFVGYCIGGALSLEMAHQLEEMGHEVELVAVVDSGLPLDPVGDSQPSSRLHKELHRGGPTHLARFIGRRLRVRGRRYWDLTFGGAEGRRRVNHEIVERACRRAFKTYMPSQVDAPILLIRSSDYAQRETKDRHMQWAEMTPELLIEIIDARHVTIMKEPAVGEVARSITQHLEET